MTGIQRIAIIGAGAAGLCAARQLSHIKNFEPVVFELTDRIGGTWFYTDEIDKDKNGYPIQSSMYKNLRTNLPRQVMAFPDFPFDSSLPSFLHHDDMLQYLKDYAAEFSLHQYIKLNTLVDNICIVPGDEESEFPKWRLKTYNWDLKKHEESDFDGVVVCNGHYTVPNMPEIKGMKDFKGTILHSHQFRTNDQFIGKNVVLFGGLSSGQDIALVLSKVAKNVYLSHKGARMASPLPSNLHDEMPICSLTNDEVIFEDGNAVKCDTIMFCTGYNYNFPFFKDDSIIQNVRNRVTPLYKHVLHIRYPNLSFIGLCVHICPFPQFHCQAMLVTSVLEGSLTLPSAEEMLEEQENDYQKRVEDGLPIRGAHVLGNKQWAYNNELADMCGKKRISDSVRLLYDLCHQRRRYNLQDYKNDKFSLSDKGHYYRCNSDSENRELQ